MGKLGAIILAGALAGFFLYGNNPQVRATCTAAIATAESAAYHVKGIAGQVRQDVGSIEKTVHSVAGQ